MMEVQFRVEEDGRMPERKTQGAAGFDCYARKSVRVMPHTTAKVPLGFGVAIPEGYCGLLFLRSSIAAGGRVTAPSVGVVDSDYRGEVCGVVQTRDEEFVVRAGDRLVQMVIVPVLSCWVKQVAELPPTERGEGGFGSTGR